MGGDGLFSPCFVCLDDFICAYVEGSPRTKIVPGRGKAKNLQTFFPSEVILDHVQDIGKSNLIHFAPLIDLGPKSQKCIGLGKAEPDTFLLMGQLDVWKWKTRRANGEGIFYRDDHCIIHQRSALNPGGRTTSAFTV